MPSRPPSCHVEPEPPRPALPGVQPRVEVEHEDLGLEALSASFAELQASVAEDCARISGLLDGHARALRAMRCGAAPRPLHTPPPLAGGAPPLPDASSPSPEAAGSGQAFFPTDSVTELTSAAQPPKPPNRQAVGGVVAGPESPKASPIVAWQHEGAAASSQLREGAVQTPPPRVAALPSLESGDSVPGDFRSERHGPTSRPGKIASRGGPRPVKQSNTGQLSVATGSSSTSWGAARCHGMSPKSKTPSAGWRRQSQGGMARVSRFLSPGGGNVRRTRTNAFADAKNLEDAAERVAWHGEYDVAELYHTEGAAQWLARHPVFTAAQLIVVILNVVWIGIETDYNHKEVLYEADLGFQLVENLFCIFFLWEWIVRLCAFRSKVQCVGDFWFVFDSALLGTMVLETWVLFFVSAVSRGGGSTGYPTDLLRMVKLARLTRSVRVARVLRSVPELAVIMRGIMVVMRTVFLILMLLTSLLYVFGIIFVQIARDTELNENGEYKDVPSAMMTLVLGGLIPDMAPTTYAIAGESWLFAAMFLIFVFLGCITIMNMLIGVLVQVVGVVATVEAETNQLAEVKSVLLDNPLDLKEHDFVTAQQIKLLLKDEDIDEGLRNLSIDTDDLLNHSQIVFWGKSNIRMYDLWQLAVQHRGSNVAKVKDLVNFRQFLYAELTDLSSAVAQLHAANARRPSTAAISLTPTLP